MCSQQNMCETMGCTCLSQRTIPCSPTIYRESVEHAHATDMHCHMPCLEGCIVAPRVQCLWADQTPDMRRERHPKPPPYTQCPKSPLQNGEGLCPKTGPAKSGTPRLDPPGAPPRRTPPKIVGRAVFIKKPQVFPVKIVGRNSGPGLRGRVSEGLAEISGPSLVGRFSGPKKIRGRKKCV